MTDAPFKLQTARGAFPAQTLQWGLALQARHGGHLFQARWTPLGRMWAQVT